jgi:hypothetical protein
MTTSPHLPRHRLTSLALALAVLALLPRPALAQERRYAAPAPAPAPAPRTDHLGFVADFTLEFGGDKIATVVFTDGSTQSVNAGQGGTLSLGAHYRPAELPIDLVGTVGYKFVTTKASNADIGVTRFVVQALGLYDPVGEFWIGGGPVLHLGTTFSGGGLVDDVNFDPSLGLTVQAGWRWIGLDYTLMTYKVNGISVDASAFGFSLRWRS